MKKKFGGSKLVERFVEEDRKNRLLGKLQKIGKIPMEKTVYFQFITAIIQVLVLQSVTPQKSTNFW